MAERPHDKPNRKPPPPRPYLLPGGLDEEHEQVAAELRVARAANPLPRSTLGDLGAAVRLTGPDSFRETTLVQPLGDTTGIDLSTVRLFRAERRRGALAPIWTSGVNAELGYAWATVRRPGLYVPIGLPRDRVLREILRSLAESRRRADHQGDEGLAHTREAFEALLEVSEDELEEFRSFLATFEVKTSLSPVPFEELEFGQGGHLKGFRLPGGISLDELRGRLKELDHGPEGLPEEALFYPPELPRDVLPWPRKPGLKDVLDPSRLPLDRFEKLPFPIWKFPICLLLSRNWWMYHANERHTGVAAGCSDITSTNVGSLVLQSDVAVDGTVVSIPSIVDGKIYVGTGGYGTNSGTLYKIDLATGVVEGKHPTTGNAFYPYDGIGGSPAVVAGRIYFTAVHGKVYCVDAATMTPSPPHPAPVWVVDLKHADAAHNQPVNNPNADSWTSPLVVNGRVYVASGEGESSGTFSFIYCLDAATGTVLWLYCTNQFTLGVDNSPNVIPQSTAGLSPLPAMFTTHADPPHAGASPWSSCAYDGPANRIYVGTGNSQPDNPLPDERYASGIISLDATTGAFGAFFQPAPTDSYRQGAEGDLDVDVPAGPMIFRRGAQRVVCIGSKNGSFFLLDPVNLNVLARRQLLPKDALTGATIPTVDPHAGFQGENKWGVLGTAAVHSASGKLFVGLGGYVGIDDYRVTPFVRALDWNTLADAWPTANAVVGANTVSRYSAAQPPLYTTPGEGGLSSPAVVNDVLFVSTSKTGLYALSVANGLCLWQAPGMPAGGWPNFCLGPAVYGDWVVVGAASKVLIYHLPHRRPWPPWWWDEPWWQRYIEIVPPWPPPPPPDPFGPREIDAVVGPLREG
jgi:outer membrane protein assembly factor BamB